jgi:hypothetical protein
MSTEAPAAPSPPQQTNSPFHQPIAPPGPGSPLKPPTPGSRAWAEQRGRAADPTAGEWARMTASERYEHESATRDRQDRSGPNFVHTRDRSGNVVITERETGQVVDGDAPSGDQPAPPVAQEKVKVGRYEIDETSLGLRSRRRLRIINSKFPPTRSCPGTPNSNSMLTTLRSALRRHGLIRKDWIRVRSPRC